MKGRKKKNKIQKEKKDEKERKKNHQLQDMNEQRKAINERAQGLNWKIDMFLFSFKNSPKSQKPLKVEVVRYY